MGPNLAVIAGRRWLIVSDGGAWTQVPLPDQETLVELVTSSNETWFLLENSVKRFSASNLTLQSYAWPGFRYGRLSISGDGGVWVNDYASSNGLFRAQAPGWVQVNTPCIDEFAPVSALEGVMRCNAGWGPTELWSVGQGRSPQKLLVTDGGISSLTAATPDTIFFNDFWGDRTLYRVDLDGGFAPFPRAVSGSLHLASDGQPFQQDSTFLYRIVGSSWQATNSFANGVSVIDLWGERGLNLSPYGELELFDATSSRQLLDYDVTRSHRTTYLAPQFFEGPGDSPRFLIDFTHIYALTDAGTLAHDLELPRAASTIVGNRDGGFMFVASQAYVVQYAGGVFTERFVPMAGNGITQLAETTGGPIFVRTTFPNRLMALLADGGTLALDAGFDPQGLSPFGADQVLVFRKTPPAAVVIDGRTLSAMPFVLPAVSTIDDVCQAGTRAYSVGQGGVRWQDAPGSWQLATSRVTFGPLICSENGASAVVSTSAIIQRIDGGAASEHVSPFWSPPTRSFLDRLGRLWASQSPSDIAVHP